MKLRTIEHTADVGIEVEADSLEELFAGAASGMLSLIAETAFVSPTTSRGVSLEAADLDELMFLWLNELIYLMGSEGLLLSKFDVKRVEGLVLEATVMGERIDPARHDLRGDVKAATYHQLAVERRDGGWFARIIFDV